MSIIDSLGLPRINDRIIDELHYCMECYNQIVATNDKRINQDARKKMILNNTFDILSGIFNFDYDEKLKFNVNNVNSNDIYINNINGKNFQQLFFEMFNQSFNKYLSNLHLISNDRIDEKLFTLSRLAYLNDDKASINYLLLAAYQDLLTDLPWLADTQLDIDIVPFSVSELETRNSLRNKKLKEEVMQYKPYEDITHYQIRNIFKCYSNDIFKKLTKEEKLHLLNLTYNYFLMDEKQDITGQYKNIVSDTTNNKECLKYVIEASLQKGNNLLIMKRNREKIKDILSWLPVIYSNESNKKNIGNLDDLSQLVFTYKR